MSVKAIICCKQYDCEPLLLCVALLLDAAVMLEAQIRFKVGELLVFHSCSGLLEIDARGLFVWCGTSGM